MGFNSVYRALQEVFPQVYQCEVLFKKVDARILKAVAIEHSKDVDAAVEVVLLEVLPNIPYKSMKQISLPENQRLVDLMEGRVAHEEQSNLSEGKQLREEAVVSSHSDMGSAPAIIECVISEEKYQESDIVVGIGQVPPVAAVNENNKDNSFDGCLICETQEDFRTNSSEFAATVYGNTCQQKSCLDCNRADIGNGLQEIRADAKVLHVNSNTVEVGDGLVQLESDVQEPTYGASDNAFQSAIDSDNLDPEYKELEMYRGFYTFSEQDLSDTGKHCAGYESNSNNIVTQSGQICRIDLLEDIIEEAKNNKKTLFSAMDLVINMMKEVELQEESVKLAKEEAAKGGLDMLARVEDIKQMLKRAREANDMHRGEVYGEKAILVTEVKELQSRLINLLEERDKSLAILEEMREKLEERLAAAEEERNAAEKQKLDKEEDARSALTEQELPMDRVVQESRMLQQEAEENSRLREFLMDRGRLVDILQGEISVICQDVRLLKEKFDEHVPLSKSLSSSQTSCILASSSSSSKSIASDRSPQQQTNSLDSLKKISRTPSLESLSPGFVAVESMSPRFTPEGKRNEKDSKELSDDGWDMFDNYLELSR
ncbi:hypothetical protein RJ641_031007 [Dillenia turbinata]|uniref:CUE domain-containing protein n=1 Tax=Dillenia turbinata TaxID=194707 RepID=A0AAN8ZE98_9MAGN